MECEDPMQHTSTSWEELPPDIRHQVVGRIFPSHRHARLVSKELKRDNDQLVRRTSLNQLPADLPFISAFPHLRVVDMSGCSQLLPEGALAAALGAMAAVGCLKTLILSTWSIARVVPPQEAFAFAAPASSSSSSSVMTIGGSSSGAAAAAAAASECRYQLHVPTEIGLLQQLERLVVKPVPGLVNAKLDSVTCQFMPPSIMELQKLRSLELDCFLPAVHYLRGLPQLQHLLLAAGASTLSDGILTAAVAALGAAKGLTSLRMQLMGSGVPFLSAPGFAYFEKMVAERVNEAAQQTEAAAGAGSGLGSSSSSGASGGPSSSAWDTPEASSDSGSTSSSSSRWRRSSSIAAAAGREQALLPPSSSAAAAEAEAAATPALPLRVLELSGAYLRQLPRSVAALTSLHALLLNHNCLRSEDVGCIAAMTQLTHLELAHNQLMMLPASWTSLKALAVLELGGNALLAFPEVLLLGPVAAAAAAGAGEGSSGSSGSSGGSSRLQQLGLKGNQLLELPEGVGALSRLEHLDLSSNKLQALPSQLSELPALRHLDLSRNRLQQLPPGLPALQALTHLDVSGNHLDTTPCLSQLLQLQHLSLGLNYLKTALQLPLAACGGGGGCLVSLELPHVASSLPEAGALFAALGGLSGLTRLNMSCNQLQAVPEEWVHLRYLKVLLLAHNALPALPQVLCSLPSLTHLDISYNRLRALNPAISQLQQLQHLNAAKNHLKQLPGELTALYCLRHLELTGNNLTALPRGLGTSLGRLQVLQLGGNHKLRREEGLGELAGLPGLRLVTVPALLGESGAVQCLRAAGMVVQLD